MSKRPIAGAQNSRGLIVQCLYRSIPIWSWWRGSLVLYAAWLHTSCHTRHIIGSSRSSFDRNTSNASVRGFPVPGYYGHRRQELACTFADI